MHHPLKSLHFWYYLTSKIDFLSHLLFNNVYFYIYHNNSSKVTALNIFHNCKVDTSLKTTTTKTTNNNHDNGNNNHDNDSNNHDNDNNNNNNNNDNNLFLVTFTVNMCLIVSFLTNQDDFKNHII